ncbi:MAG: alpha-glucosidase C-terminal domain-containing protein, partial [Planctomycetota bacterium]
PSNRMPMVWQDLEPYEDPEVRFRPSLFEHYQKWIALRQAVPALRRGLYRTVLAPDEGGVLVFERSLDDQRVYVVINRSPRPATIAFDVADDDHGRVFVDLAASAKVSPKSDAPDARPTLRIDQGAALLTAENGQLKITQPRYAVSVMVRPGSLK